jgi:hypothetical protein
MKRKIYWIVTLFALLPMGMWAQTFTQTNGAANTCSGNYYDSGGAGGTYTNGENSTYTICSNSGNCIRIAFTAFDLESGWDYLYVYDGPSTASPLIGTYTGTTSPGVVTSSTGCLTFRFTSDGSITYTGWAASISCVACGAPPSCLPNIGNCSEVSCASPYYDNGGSGGNYSNNASFTHTICGTPGNCVRVAFSSFQLESGFDFLSIYDGPTTGAPLIGTYSGTTSPGTVTSTSGCLTFRFTTDGSVTYTGWAATITCIPCGGGPCLPNIGNCTANVCSGSFFDTGGAGGNYGTNESFTQTICSNSGNCVQVNFSSFQTESGFDLLTIYDGPTTASPVLGTFSGNANPGTVTSTTGCLTFRWVTDGTVVMAGWQATISCVTCPGNFNCLINPVSNGHLFPAGFTQTCDDFCSSNLIPLGFTYNICGGAYTDMYVNMNGNITFGSSFTTFTPVGMPNTGTAVMVAPFWADVDTRGGCGTVYHRANPTNAIVTWYNVGYYNSQCDKLNTFQLIISNGFDPLIGVGNNTAFYYEGMSWTTGSASSGVNGFGGAPATAGINANDGINYSQIGEFDHAGASYDGPHGATDGIDYLDFRCFTFPAGGCAILPVNYTSITATPVENTYISLDWSTNSESNNLGFEVERSVDGVVFERLGFVDGQGQNGNAAVNYTYADRNVEREVVYWYRLKQLDGNGNHLYSPVVRAMITSAYLGHVGKAFPNPFAEEVSVELNAQVAGTCELRLVNTLGQVVRRESKEVLAGFGVMSIATDDLAGGVYTLAVSLNGRQISAQKVVK